MSMDSLHDQFPETTRAVIFGLTGNQAQYNGHQVLVNRTDHATGMISVTLPYDKNGKAHINEAAMKRLSLHPKNLDADPRTVVRKLHEDEGNWFTTLQYLYQRGSLLYDRKQHADGIQTLDQMFCEFGLLTSAHVDLGRARIRDFDLLLVKAFNLRAMCKQELFRSAARADNEGAAEDYRLAIAHARAHNVPLDLSPEAQRALVPTLGVMLSALARCKVGQPRPHYTPEDRRKWQKLLNLGNYFGCFACFKLASSDGKPLMKCGKCLFAKYCSAECQRAHWKQAHKAECAKLCEQLEQGGLVYEKTPLSFRKRVYVLKQIGGRSLVEQDLQEHGFFQYKTCAFMRDPDTGELFDSLSDLDPQHAGILIEGLPAGSNVIGASAAGGPAIAVSYAMGFAEDMQGLH
jgi:hypothetical protein